MLPAARKLVNIHCVVAIHYTSCSWVARQRTLCRGHSLYFLQLGSPSTYIVSWPFIILPAAGELVNNAGFLVIWWIRHMEITSILAFRCAKNTGREKLVKNWTSKPWMSRWKPRKSCQKIWSSVNSRSEQKTKRQAARWWCVRHVWQGPFWTASHFNLVNYKRCHSTKLKEYDILSCSKWNRS